MIRRDYYANGGWETFLEYGDPEQDILIGLLRLRKCSKQRYSFSWYILIPSDLRLESPKDPHRMDSYRMDPYRMESGSNDMKRSSFPDSMYTYRFNSHRSQDPTVAFHVTIIYLQVKYRKVGYKYPMDW